MAQPITDQVGFLGEACRAVQELSASRSLLEKFRQEESRLDKELDAERKAVTDTISLTVKKRIEEINDTYDKEIAREQDRLKRVRSKREKAKTQGVRERIEEETAELKGNNRELMLQMKSVFQQDRVPGLCKSGWYYALYLPRGFSEFLVLLLNIFLFFLAIPCGIYLLLPEKSPFYLIGIYFVVILFFGGIYILINNLTKVRHQSALNKGRSIRDLIKSNKRKIKVIVHSIKRDRDEAVYNLEKYDDEIARIDQDLSNIADKKREALNTFDKVTKTILSDEIAGNSREKIAKLEEDYEAASANANEAEIRVKEQTLFINDNYASYIGKEFMVPDRLDELADMIRMGKASSISEAKALYKNLKE
ncbi:hypothetical protein [Lacrimispora celerecrescens]|uniref:ATPase involved in DNA repair n=1 Tax=Lacrimispora celerecrescens TaxID=29354 RepID=A0A084JKP8_9FIRM|nr:hypothetical protein [Lacrimispora celerecrescens]KEZ89532.1 hypothetical protein IO98_14615 [Lacrimispora celerecrescens]